MKKKTNPVIPNSSDTAKPLIFGNSIFPPTNSSKPVKEKKNEININKKQNSRLKPKFITHFFGWWLFAANTYIYLFITRRSTELIPILPTTGPKSSHCWIVGNIGPITPTGSSGSGNILWRLLSNNHLVQSNLML